MIPDVFDQIDDAERQNDRDPYFASDNIPVNGDAYEAAAMDAELMSFDEWQDNWAVVDGELMPR